MLIRRRRGGHAATFFFLLVALSHQATPAAPRTWRGRPDLGFAPARGADVVGSSSVESESLSATALAAWALPLLSCVGQSLFQWLPPQ